MELLKYMFYILVSDITHFSHAYWWPSHTVKLNHSQATAPMLSFSQFIVLHDMYIQHNTSQQLDKLERPFWEYPPQ